MFAPEVICFTFNPNDLVSLTAPFGTALMSSTNMLLTRCYKEFSWSEKCKNICWQMDRNMDDNHSPSELNSISFFFPSFCDRTSRENIRFYRYDFCIAVSLRKKSVKLSRYNLEPVFFKRVAFYLDFAFTKLS